MGQPVVRIPIIDISGYLAGEPGAKAKVAAELRTACEEQGFLQVVGHAVPEDVQARFLDAIQRFFALPMAEKEKLSQSNSKCYRGYERLGGQKLDELDTSATPDQKEGFSVRPERPLGKFLQGPNQWPENLRRRRAHRLRSADPAAPGRCWRTRSPAQGNQNVASRPAHRQCVRVQHRRSDAAMDQRPLQVDHASRHLPSQWQGSIYMRLLQRRPVGHDRRVLAHLHRNWQRAPLRANQGSSSCWAPICAELWGCRNGADRGVSVG